MPFYNKKSKPALVSTGYLQYLTNVKSFPSPNFFDYFSCGYGLIVILLQCTITVVHLKWFIKYTVYRNLLISNWQAIRSYIACVRHNKKI